MSGGPVSDEQEHGENRGKDKRSSNELAERLGIEGDDGDKRRETEKKQGDASFWPTQFPKLVVEMSLIG